MNSACNLLKFIVLFLFFHNSESVGIPEYLHECYSDREIVSNENKLPRNMFTFIELLRKIERDEQFSMSMRMFAPALIRRFRCDGILRNEDNYIDDQNSIPYYVGDYTSAKLEVINKIILGDITKFPNNSLSRIERCSLHTMMSTNINLLRRDDESDTCKIARDAYRRRYLRDIQESECPIEDGTILTNSGTINVGSVIAGIAAGLSDRSVLLKDLLKNFQRRGKEIMPHDFVNSQYFTTITGDLAEVTLRQSSRKKFILGTNGNWDSMTIPKWYYLSKSEESPIGYEMTMAELKGDIDGFLLYLKSSMMSRNANMQLSQLLDMYYNSRGVFNDETKACNRFMEFKFLNGFESLPDQNLVAIKILDGFKISKVSFNDSALKKYSEKVLQEFTSFMSKMEEDTKYDCANEKKSKESLAGFNPSVDLTIFLDTTWNFKTIQNLLVQILEGIEVGQYNSNVTILNAKDGSIIVNTTNTILDFYASFNETSYGQLSKGTNMASIFGVLEKIQPQKLEREKSEGLGGQRSDVVLIMPYGDNRDNVQDAIYYDQQMERIRREVPDCVILFYVNANKERWTRFIFNRETDLFSFNIGQERTAATALISRIKEVPKRLINTQCGAYYQTSSRTYSYEDYVAPYSINFYRIHPNYFFKYDQYNEPKVQIHTSERGILEVCVSRDVLSINNFNEIKTKGSLICRNISDSSTGRLFETSLSCYDKYLIQDCKPYYFSVRAIRRPDNVQCLDNRNCRYADMVKYKISYENLSCQSSSTTIFLAPVLLISVLIKYLL